MKKIIIFILGLFVLLCYNSSVAALNVKQGSNYSSLPVLENSETYLGKLHNVSTVITKSPLVTFHSNWAPWQPDLYQDFNEYRYELYEADKYIDLIVKNLEVFRIESNEKLSKKFVTNEKYSVTQEACNTSAVKAFISYEHRNNLGVSGVFDIMHIDSNSSNYFKISEEYQKIITIKNVGQYNHSISCEYVENYQNNSNTYRYVHRCMRQKFKVLIGVKYKYNYERIRYGSGLGGVDDNYTYKQIDFTASEVSVVLMPKEVSYYHVSYYNDNVYGEKVFCSQTNPNIIFL